MEQLDKNQSYFFLFDKDSFSLEQVRSFSLEECYRQCINDEWCQTDNIVGIEEEFNSYSTGEDGGDEPWWGYGEFLHARIAPDENYIFYELLNAYWSYRPFSYSCKLICLLYSRTLFFTRYTQSGITTDSGAIQNLSNMGRQER